MEVSRGQRYLAETRDGVIGAVSALSGAQWKFKPGPDRWSMGEVVEHLALVEEVFLKKVVPRLGEAPAGAPDRDPQRLDALVLAWEPDPTIKVVIPGRMSLGEAPPQLAPTRLWNPEEALARFIASRGETADFLGTAPADVRQHVIEHPALGPMDGYQWVLFIAAHSARHTQQLLGLRAHPKFPGRISRNPGDHLKASRRSSAEEARFAAGGHVLFYRSPRSQGSRRTKAGGAGAASRHSIGTGVFAGMLVATLVGIFFIPLFFSVIGGVARRRAGDLTALQEADDALVGLRLTRDQLVAQDTQVQALRRALERAQRRYENGVSSYLEVLDAQRGLFNAQLGLVQTERQYLGATVRLYKAVGGGWKGAVP